MKIFTSILVLLALALIVFNITQLDFQNPFQGDSAVALIGIAASFCAVLILLIFRISKVSKKKQTIDNMFDVLLIGGGVSSMSCTLVLGSAKNKAFVTDKKIGIFTHQKNSSLQEAIFYNAYGIAPGKLGSELLTESTAHLAECYPHIIQIENEKVIKIEGAYPEFIVITNKDSYQTKNIVIGIGSANTFAIEGLMQFVEPHKKALPEKQRIQLKNEDHKVADGIYVIGTLAGWRSQLAIAAGSGAAVATDILTLWNNGTQTHAHDSIR